jgi:hypothetical protein
MNGIEFNRLGERLRRLGCVTAIEVIPPCVGQMTEFIFNRPLEAAKCKDSAQQSQHDHEPKTPGYSPAETVVRVGHTAARLCAIVQSGVNLSQAACG